MMELETKKKPNRPGRPAPGKTLTPSAVAEAAARLIDAEGMDDFTMRRLGQVLGVEAMALYNHFDHKDAIIGAVASLTLARIPVPPIKGTWRNRIKGVCRAVRELAHQHPNLFRLAFSRRILPTAALPVVEGLLAAFSDAGLGPEAQVSAYHTIHLYVRGFCLWELEQFPRLPQGEPLPQIPAINGEYPRTGAVRQWIFAPDLEREFEAGLDTILGGLSQQRRR
jgi:AcrR family transcriptional regulator